MKVVQVTLPLLGVLASSSLVGAASQLPAFKVERWVNSTPLTVETLRGKVVLLDVWEYTCINWIRTAPYVKAWHRDYATLGLVVVGLHAPEFEFGKRAGHIDRGIRDHGLTYPIAIDNDFATWRALGNDAWPAQYLFDDRGRLVKRGGDPGAIGCGEAGHAIALDHPRGGGVCEERSTLLCGNHQRDVRRFGAPGAGHDQAGRELANRSPVHRTPQGHRHDQCSVHRR
jgi:hypothetical protein